jgi:hypothetical protein
MEEEVSIVKKELALLNSSYLKFEERKIKNKMTEDYLERKSLKQASVIYDLTKMMASKKKRKTEFVTSVSSSSNKILPDKYHNKKNVRKSYNHAKTFKLSEANNDLLKDSIFNIDRSDESVKEISEDFVPSRRSSKLKRASFLNPFPSIKE